MVNTILVFHSDRDTKDSLKRILSDQGFPVFTAKSVEDCVKQIRDRRPTLVLMESYLPREKVLSEVQKLKESKILYILSDDSDKGDLTLYENVVGFVDQPFEVDKFVEKIKKALK